MEDEESGLRPRWVAELLVAAALALLRSLRRCDDSEDSEIMLRTLRTSFSGIKEVKKSHSEGRLTATTDMPASSIAK